MPINLRYGQQAVARGFVSKQRLDQVLAKQRQLAEQGKKVSVRMILEKAKLLSGEQLLQIDRDLNIKVVKKHTGQIKKPGAPGPGPTGAQNFAGEAPPQFSGVQGQNPDVTVFSPPPADMQDKIRAERERAQQDARRKQEQEASAFFGDENASPFGDDPFGNEMAPAPAGSGNEMAPEPMGFGDEMSPEPAGFGEDPFAAEMSPEPEPMGAPQQGGFAEMQPMSDDPFGDDMSPQPAGFNDNQPFGGAQDEGFSDEPAELDRMDSSPKLASLGAEFDGFANPEDEELPTLNSGFDDDQGRGAPPKQQPAAPSAPTPAGGFAGFGGDIRSPEELESAPGPSAGGTKPLGSDVDGTMFSPPPPGVGAPGRQKTGAMDRTVFSPRPPEFGGPQPGPQPMEAEPAGDDWGEAPSMEPEPFGDEGGLGEEGFGEEAPVGNDMDATGFSPPPAQMPQPHQESAPPPRGRKGDDDFGDVEFPKSGSRPDDVPTAPASMDDEVHPLRRGVGTSSASHSTGRPAYDEEVADELPADVDVPDELPDDEPAAPVGVGKGKLPGKAPKSAKLPKGRGARELPQREVPAPGKKEKKGTSKRVLLIFTILLLVFVAVIVVPISFEEQVPQLKELRRNQHAEPIYDYVDYDIMDRFREWTGQPTKRPPREMTEIPTGIDDTGEDTGDDTGEDSGDDTGEDSGEDSGEDTGEDTGEEADDTNGDGDEPGEDDPPGATE